MKVREGESRDHCALLHGRDCRVGIRQAVFYVHLASILWDSLEWNDEEWNDAGMERFERLEHLEVRPCVVAVTQVSAAAVETAEQLRQALGLSRKAW